MEPLKLVIIEDEEAHFRLMKRAIDEEFPSASVDYFQDPAAFWKALDRITPDVIITDYLMPGMSGIQLLKSLNRGKRDIPVIMITGQGDERVAVEAMKLGAWDYLVKSGDFFTLMPSVIQKVVCEKKLKDTLNRTERIFKEIFTQSPISIGLYNFNGELLNVNESYLDIFGISEVAQVKGLNFLDDLDVSPEIKGLLLEGQTTKLEALFDFEKAKKLNLHKSTRSGTAFLDVVITPMSFGAEHCENGYLVQIQDIAERKRAEEALQRAHDELERHVNARTAELAKTNKELKLEIEERRRAEQALRENEKKYSTLVENSLTGIYIEQDGHIVFANNKFAEMYGYSREELVSLESWRLVHPEDRAFTNKITARRLRGEDVLSEYEARGLTRDNETVWINRRNTRIEYKGRPAILGNVVDITKRKRAEEELRRANEEIKNFVHVVSHDLKTPIISIQGFSSRFLKNCGEQLDEKGRSYLEHIKACGRRMEVLVSDLATLLEIRRVEPVLQDVSSLEIVRNVASSHHDRLKENRIELVVADLPIIFSDAERIWQVFDNLLVNAIKYMGNTTDPRIEIGYEDQEDFCQFYVRDNGIGIDPKYHLRIFEMFHRLERNKAEGTGLGLAIVERIVTSHGGKIWVESQKGKGATFYFTLPKASCTC